MVESVRPFLMFEGDARAAIDLYVSLIPGSELRELVLYGPGETGPEGTVMRALVSLAGQEVMFTDSPITHGFTFTPASSFFLECSSEEEIQRLFTSLSEGGAVMMPLDEYWFSPRFAWVADRFGVSWQLNLA